MGILASGLLIAVVPFALSDTVNGALIAGIFSVVNTALNLRLIRIAKENRNIGRGTRSDAREANADLLKQVKKNGTDEKE